MSKLRNFIFILSATLFALPLQAERVFIEKAEKVAESYIRSVPRLNGQTNVKLLRAVTKELLVPGLRNSGQEEEPMYYVFGMNDNQGFIIVSADDVAVPILGYAEQGTYDETNANFMYWMECLAQEINYAIENKIPQDEEIKGKWKAYYEGKAGNLRATNAVVVSPLLQTQWNQTSPYNDLCPSGTYTGCVATAMSQIMKKHNTPASRTVTIPAYTTRTNKTNIPAITGTTNYAWSSMTNTYSSGSSQAAKTAVATLMYHCGAGSQMDYTSTGSSAYTRDAALALINYFGYDQSLQFKYRKDYSNTDWENLLRTELSVGRPVYYSGYNDVSGHAFVCDGYDSNGTYHFNWGWGGYQDGYFVTTALNPGGGGAGAGAGTYNSKQEIIINIKPNAGGAKYYELRISDSNNITSTKTSVARGETFTVDAPVRNASLFPYTGEAGIALVNVSNDQIVAIVGQKSINELGSGYYNNSPYNFNCAVPASVSAGNYKLRVASKVSGATQWTIISGTPGYTDVLNLTVTSEIRTHGIKIVTGSALTNSVTSTGRGEAFTVSAKLGNRGTSTFTGDYGVALVDNSDRIMEIIGVFWTNMTLQAGYTYGEPFTTICGVSSSITPGNYKIRAVAKPAGENWSIAYGESGVTDILNLTVTSTIVQDNSRVYLDMDLTPSVNPVNQFSPLSVQVRVFNFSSASTSFIGELELGLYDSDGTLLELIEKQNVVISNNQTWHDYTFNSSAVISPGGTYTMSLYQKSADGVRKKVSDRDYNNSLQLTVIGTPPHVSAVSPANGATNVPAGGQLVITFDEPMNTVANIGIVRLGGGVVNNEYRTWSSGNTVCTFSYSGLNYNTTYTYSISGFKDVSGNVMAPITSGYSFTTVQAPAATAWNPQPGSSVWTESANWTNGIPASNTKVTIPASGSYPVLISGITVDEIHFAPRAQLGRQDLLTYNKAFVQLDFSSGGLARNQWHMLSMPVKQVYTGDFSFGGYPYTYLHKFNVTSTGSAVSQAEWIPFRTNAEPLVVGEGFALWLNASGDTKGNQYQGSGVDAVFGDGTRQYGLGRLNGIIEFPYFEDDETSTAHRVHKYDRTEEKSRFYAFRTSDGLPLSTNYVEVTRNNHAYRLADASSVNELLAFRNEGGNNYFAIAGNPFMTTIDFDQLYNDNPNKIKQAFYVWTGNGFSVYSESGVSGVLPPSGETLTSLIAPMQSFLVERVATENGNETLVFDITKISATNQPVTLRSSTALPNKLNITASNEEASVLTFIARREDGQDVFSDKDARKLIMDMDDIPEIYTLKPDGQKQVAVTSNIVKSDDLLIPLGIATAYEGRIVFTFSGMNQYDAKISFVDTGAGQTIDLTGLDNYEYSFDYKPEIVSNQVQTKDDRFYIRFSPSGSTALKPLPASNIAVYGNKQSIFVTSTPENPIRRIEIYNTQGVLLYVNDSVNAFHYTVSGHISIPEICIVRVVAAQGIKNVKIINSK